MNGLAKARSWRARRRNASLGRVVLVTLTILVCGSLCGQVHAEEASNPTKADTQVRVDVLVVRTTDSEQPKLVRQLKAFSAGDCPAVCTLYLGSVAQTKSALQNGFEGEVVAAPSLITQTGREAQIHVGQEIPIRVPDDKGVDRLSTLDVGLTIKVKPAVLQDSRVRLQVDFRDSKLDKSRSLQSNGRAIPGVRVAAVSTAWECRSGQGVVLSVPTKHHGNDSITFVVVEPRIYLPSSENPTGGKVDATDLRQQ